ncbi:MAG: hypothetical protein M3Z05_18815 [Gemmatimonadota bacterium]|nr:hypothetical protein [Gemmatimonadota bacterium]
MAKINDIRAERDKALEHARSIQETGTQEELRRASEAVEAAQHAMIATITKGADPCPMCKEMPTGMEQPNARGGVEYEVGCSTCPPIQHDDGSTRQPRVRGGMMPSHAVDAWNGGPDFWTKVTG